MDLAPIIQALRQRCPVFVNRVAGAAEFNAIPAGAALPVPAAYVLPLEDNPEANKAMTGYCQVVREKIGVVVAVDNSVDERGQAASASVHSLRIALFRALLGWQPAADYDPLEYAGGNLVKMDRARLFYQFEFEAEMTLDKTDTFLDYRDDNLPAFEGANINVDAIDPMADPNLKYPGPDGRIEFQARANPAQS